MARPDGNAPASISTASDINAGTLRVVSRSSSGTATGAISVAAPISDGTNGTPRTGTETRPKNIQYTAYMRVK